MTIGRANSAWEQIAAWTVTLLMAQRQLQTSTGEAERAGFYDSDRVREIVREAHIVMEITPEDALEAGRKDYEELVKTGAELAAEAGHCPPLIHAEGGGPDDDEALHPAAHHGNPDLIDVSLAGPANR